jgi:hypothetical protein
MAQQVQLLGGLGMIPSLQFSADPTINPNINPYVEFPEGMTQLTTQPTGEYRTSGEAQLQGLGSNRLRFLDGLGRRRDHRRRAVTYAARTGGQCGPGCWPIAGGGCDCSGMRQVTQVARTVGGLGVHMEHPAHRPHGLYRPSRLLDVAAGMGPAPGLHGIFDSTWWVDRKWLAFGLVGLLGLGAAALATKVLR